MTIKLEDELGDVLEKARDGKDWSQTDLARTAQVSPDVIAQIENYETVPDDNTIINLARVLDLHPPSLIDLARGNWVPLPPTPDPEKFEVVCLNLLVGSYPVKCYLLICRETRSSAVIDTGGNPDAVIKKATELGLKPEKILLTHAHFDHAGGLEKLDKAFACPAWIDKKEPKPSGSRNYKYIADGEILKLGKINIEILFTPGHTPGGVSYKVGDTVFSGDSIFAGSMGRANSSWPRLFDSITQKLLTLPDKTRLFPGHGPATTVREEKMHNPFFFGKAISR
jgi:glyoxylase-like metal-dependent hydrolase (beta-lactamase superfamily II)/plasmid maintenance system antidote protein VapI